MGSGGGWELAHAAFRPAMSWAIWPTSPASPSRVSGWAPATGAPETKDGEDAGGAVVEADGGTVVEAGGPDISDTKLVGILALPDDERRLYECEGGCLGLSERGRRRGGAVAARGKEMAQERWAARVYPRSYSAHRYCSCGCCGSG